MALLEKTLAFSPAQLFDAFSIKMLLNQQREGSAFFRWKAGHVVEMWKS